MVRFSADKIEIKNKVGRRGVAVEERTLLKEKKSKYQVLFQGTPSA